MAASHQNSYVVNVGIEKILNVIKSREFASYLNIEMKSENLTADGVWYRFHHGVTFTSWGEKITITLSRLDSGSTSLIINSECGMPTQVIDWGKNKQNVCNIYEYIERKVAVEVNNASFEPFVAPAVPQAEPAPIVEPAKGFAPQVNAAPVKKFCTNCGNKISPNDFYCANCGNPLK